MVIIREVTADLGIVDLINGGVKKPIILTPGPKDADIIREINQQILFEKKLDPITISNFTNYSIDLLCKKDLFPKEYKPKVFKKSEIFLNLAGVWEEVFGEGNDELFFQAYRVLSETRGNSIDLSLVREALSLLNDDLSKAVQVLWRFIDQQGIIDEHRAYHIIGESAEVLGLDSDSVIVIGFNHLSAVQVDMFNALSKYIDVFVYLPKGVLQSLTRFDWPMWLEGFDQLEIMTPPSTQYSKVVTFPKNRLPEFLDNKTNRNIILLKENIVPGDLLEIPFSNYDVRSDHDIFSSSIEKAFNNIADRNISIDDLKKSIKEQTRDLLLRQSENGYNFIELKVMHLLFKSLVRLEEELVSSDAKLTSFLLRILKNVCLLDAPRNSVVNFTDASANGVNVFSISDARFKQFDTLDVIIKKEDLPFSLQFDSSNRELVSFLSTIGPIKNTGLNNKMNLFWLLSTIQSTSANNVTFYIEDGSWELGEELFSFLGLVDDRQSYVHKKVLVNQLVSKNYNGKVGKFSATKLQSYIDCPRKFEEIYLKNNKSFPVLKKAILPNHLGILEHQVIEYFFKREIKNVNEQNVLSLSKELLNKYLMQNEIKLSDIDFKKSLNEIVINSNNGISFLQTFQNNYPSFKLDFEFNLPSNDLTIGQIDVLASNGKEFFIFDFKRSKGGAGNFSQILHHELIQLPFYLSEIQETMGVSGVGFGYVVLSNLADSIFIGDDNLISGSMGVGKEKILSNDEWVTFKKDCRQKYNALFLEIEAKYLEKNFTEQPRQSSVCQYCPANLFCHFEGSI